VSDQDSRPVASAAAFLSELCASTEESFRAHRRILSFPEYVDALTQHPRRFARTSAQYVLDAMMHFGSEQVAFGAGEQTRYTLFDAPFDGGEERVVGVERAQDAFVRILQNFARERRVNRLVLLHGPNGSAKSSFVGVLMRALEAYSALDEGAVYRFNWVFPRRNHETGRIGFGSESARAEMSTFAYLDEGEIDAKLPAEHNDNPIFLLPADARMRILSDAEGDEFVVGDVIRRGDLGHRSRAVYDALLAAYAGDVSMVWRHVQVERFFISKRYRAGAVTVEPQLRVDAGVRQITVDRSLNALPAALQAQTLFETYGPLVEGNRGVIEYNDIFKRPMEANKYLLATSEKGTVALDHSEIRLDALLIATANEDYLEAFKEQPDWASYKGRIELIRMPYLLDYRAEQQIYDDVLARVRTSRPVAPHTTFAVALWAVLTRLRRPDPSRYPKDIKDIIQNLSPLEKALLYADGSVPPGLKSEEADSLRRAVPDLVREGTEGPLYEGRFGASAREMKSLLLNVLGGSSPCASPRGVFEALQELVADPSLYEWLRMSEQGAYHRYSTLIDAVRQAYLSRVEREVHLATGLVDDAEYRRHFERYVAHVKQWLRGERVQDPLTGRVVPPDDAMMDEVENVLGRRESSREFRQQLISRVAAFRIDNPKEDMDLERIFPSYFESMNREYFKSKRRDLARIQDAALQVLDGEVDGLEAELVRHATSMLEALYANYGYVPETAREALGLLASRRAES